MPILTILGLFKMLLIIIGVLTLIRFLGKLMIAKRDIDAQKQLKRENESIERDRRQKLKDFGKVKITSSKVKTSSSNDAQDIEDVGYEEIK